MKTDFIKFMDKIIPNRGTNNDALTEQIAIAYSEEKRAEVYNQCRNEIASLTERWTKCIGELQSSLSSREEEIKELKYKLEAAKKALNDIKDWDDDMEDEWEDQGYRAISALKIINI